MWGECIYFRTSKKEVIRVDTAQNNNEVTIAEQINAFKVNQGRLYAISNKGLILVWTVDKSTNGGVLERKDVMKRKLSSTYKETGWAAIDSNGDLIVVSGYEEKNNMCQINILDAAKLDVLRSLGIHCDNVGKRWSDPDSSILRWNFTTLPHQRYLLNGMGINRRIYYFAFHKDGGLKMLACQDACDQVLGAVCNDFCPELGIEGERISWTISSLSGLLQENICAMSLGGTPEYGSSELENSGHSLDFGDNIGSAQQLPSS